MLYSKCHNARMHVILMGSAYDLYGCVRGNLVSLRDGRLGRQSGRAVPVIHTTTDHPLPKGKHDLVSIISTLMASERVASLFLKSSSYQPRVINLGTINTKHQ